MCIYWNKDRGFFFLCAHYTVALFCTHYTVFSSRYTPAKNVDILEGVQRETSRLIIGQERQTPVRRLKKLNTNDLVKQWWGSGHESHLRTFSLGQRPQAVQFLPMQFQVTSLLVRWLIYHGRKGKLLTFLKQTKREGLKRGREDVFSFCVWGIFFPS